MTLELDIKALSLDPVTTPEQPQSTTALVTGDDEGPEYERGAGRAVRDYLMANVKEFRRLQELRTKVCITTTHLLLLKYRLCISD
jgi:hypothetical protein